MGKRLYVGNLSYSLKSTDLEEIFRAAGEVVNVKVVMDPESGRSKGFAFVEMATDDQGAQAIETLNGKDVGGRALKVTEANPRPERTASAPRSVGAERTGDRGGFTRGGANGGFGGGNNRHGGGSDRGNGGNDRGGNRW